MFMIGKTLFVCQFLSGYRASPVCIFPGTVSQLAIYYLLSRCFVVVPATRKYVGQLLSVWKLTCIKTC